MQFKEVPKLNYAEYWHIPEDGSRPTWKKGFSKMAPIYIGKLVGTLKPSIGNCFRIKVEINGSSYFLSRILYWHYYGEDPINNYIDHADGNTLNNSKQNLRKCTTIESSINRKHKNSNTSITGIRKEQRGNYIRYKTSIGKISKKNKAKNFTDFFEAVCYRKSMEVKLGYADLTKHRN